MKRSTETQRGGHAGSSRPIVYCLVPRDLASALHEPLRRHFADDPGVEVIVERRARERRSTPDRRVRDRGVTAERRRIGAVEGRRAGERRAALVPVEPPPLPRKARPHAERLVFVERLEPRGERREDLDTARMVARIQSGERDLFATLYMRYFDRVYSYLLVVLGDRHEAEDATQQVFTKILAGLPRYVRRAQPFRAWLFVVVRNVAIDVLRKRPNLDLEETAALHGRREEETYEEADFGALGWITDRELLMFFERLPLEQRQVLLLRFMLDLTPKDIAAMLGRTPNDISAMQYRALRYLRERLSAVGRSAPRRGGEPMRQRIRAAPVLRRRRFALRP